MKIYSRSIVESFVSKDMNIPMPCVLLDTDLGILIIDKMERCHLQFNDTRDVVELLHFIEEGTHYVVLMGQKYNVNELVNHSIDIETLLVPNINWVEDTE